MDLLTGILLGGAICFLNIRWLKFFIKGILLNVTDVKKAKALTYATFLFRYLIIAGILYISAKSNAVNMMAVIIGFSAALFSYIMMLLRHNKMEVKLNGRTASLY
ncbi:MAG: ATP synthase subunit I [Nitrospinae bacterium]|nr:ATP synthase subunit I [Nitrospinota bacterium]MBI3814876.1 ATP synthase subunit I [Nitrospinota bacterium]